MQFDAALPPVPVSSAAEIARAAEAIGFGCLWSSETIHDPFLPGVLIAEHTKKIQFGTSVAVSFARSPTTLAYTAWDLAQLSNGRFILGLGTQVKAHIERRFGMLWPDSVVGKLREQIAAIRALWNCWQNGTKLSFRGEYYHLNLMTPFFNPGPIAQPDIPVYVAGVNRGLAQLAGEVADGFLVHPFHSPSYLAQVIAPAIGLGLSHSQRKRSDVKITTTAFVVTSPEEDWMVRAQIAFYASTPSYRTLMQYHGWESIAQDLSTLASQGKWSDMPDRISDEILNTIATIAPAHELAKTLYDRYSGLTDRLMLYLPFQPGERDDFWQVLVRELG